MAENTHKAVDMQVQSISSTDCVVFEFARRMLQNLSESIVLNFCISLFRKHVEDRHVRLLSLLTNENGVKTIKRRVGTYSLSNLSKMIVHFIFVSPHEPLRLNAIGVLSDVDVISCDLISVTWQIVFHHFFVNFKIVRCSPRHLHSHNCAHGSHFLVF